MPRIDAFFRVADRQWQALLKSHKKSFISALQTALAAIDLPETTFTVAVSLVSDAEIRQLNSQYRGKDKATNVLSFPQLGDFDTIENQPQPVELGDIVLAFETIHAEATAQGKLVVGHVMHLLVHGFLHLLGYDHLTEDEAGEMEMLETDILATLGVANPYLLAD